MNIEEEYNYHCLQASDINEHLPVLKEYADKCDSVIEMGVRRVVSTWAFLASGATSILSIDYVHPKTLSAYDVDEELPLLSKGLGKNYKFIEADTRIIDIEPVDMIFIDTFHTYEQLSVELLRHGNKAKKYLAFHDTETFGWRDEVGAGPGLNKAIEEFLSSNPHWSVDLVRNNNNGLTILKRKTL